MKNPQHAFFVRWLRIFYFVYLQEVKLGRLEQQRLYEIAITLIPGIGDKMAKTLIAHCGSAEAVFKEKKMALTKIPGIGSKTAEQVVGQTILSRAEEEFEFIQKKEITSLFFLDEDYPQRLKMCEDAPVMLYYKGNADLNKRQIISIVGTRNATSYGVDFCKEFIQELKTYNPLVISGLAYGIDICAHKESLKNGVPTVGVLAHGLDRIYPALHTNVADQMVENGGLITEFLSETNPDRENFPKRNRIVAGMSDAVIVVEAAIKGGALITAEIANSYNREVFAVPGNLKSTFSEGCNHLIKINKAALLESVKDLEYILGWKERETNVSPQIPLFPDLSADEEKLVQLFKQAPGYKMQLEELCLKSGFTVSKLLQILMTLELKGVVKNYPGKVFGLAGM